MRRAIIVVALVGLVLGAGMVVRVDYEAYDGCNWHGGEQPLLVAPISLLSKEPIGESDVMLGSIRACRHHGERGFRVGPFGSVPSLEEAELPPWR